MYNKKDLIDFEKKVYDLFESGDLPYLIHLCGGNEDNLIEIFKEIKYTVLILAVLQSQ
jgi:hypothetical protein